MQYLTNQYKTDCVSKRLTLEIESFLKCFVRSFRKRNCWQCLQQYTLEILF